MVEYGLADQKHITELFDAFRKNEVRYVVPRGYKNLPESVPGGDIDLIVKEEDYATAVNVCRQQGYQKVESKVKDLIKLIRQGVSKPCQVTHILATEPLSVIDEITNIIFQQTTKDDQLASKYKEYKAKKGGILVHITNHLGYTSPYNGKKIRVDQTVEEKLHERAETYGQIRKPSAPDELAHIICRGIFDNEGTFPQYYIKWCESLKKDIMADENYWLQFEKLLELLFYNASGIVIENIKSGKYNEIKSDLIKYGNY